MAAINTNSLTSSPTQTEFVSQALSLGSLSYTIESFDPWPYPSTVNYIQRVWDTGTVGWCYYTKTTIDASPLSTETSPNWTGTISNHSVVGVV